MSYEYLITFFALVVDVNYIYIIRVTLNSIGILSSRIMFYQNLTSFNLIWVIAVLAEAVSKENHPAFLQLSVK